MYKQWVSAVLLLAFLFAGCAKKKVKDGPRKDNSGALIEKDDALEKKYMQEGFISSDTFRIIIIADRADCESSPRELAEKARKRALATLQKLLASRDITITNNIRAEFLGLIKNNGTFRKESGGCAESNIYFFEIRHPDIRDHIRKIASTNR